MKRYIPQIAVYQQRLSLPGASFSRILHDSTMVAIVYKVICASGTPLILKICPRDQDYFREVYFLNHFKDILPVPRIVEVVQPKKDLYGAILMEYLPGSLLSQTDFTDELAYEIGSVLARIHMARVRGYGDLTQLDDLRPDPRIYFTSKFDEGLAECRGHLPESLMERCCRYYETHLDLLDSVDGPCIIHRDFRPGNVMVDGGKLQGIIDWASGRASFAQEDFCPLEFGEWPTKAASKKSFLAGYASIRPVPEYHPMMQLLRLNRAFSVVGFTVKNATWNSINMHLYQVNRRFLETFT